MQYEQTFVLALLFTVFVETTVLFLLLKFFFSKDYKKMKFEQIAFTGFFASFSTIPYLWFVLPAFFPNYLTFILVGEGLVFAFETFIISRLLSLELKKAAALSFLCNLASFSLGLLIF